MTDPRRRDPEFFGRVTVHDPPPPQPPPTGRSWRRTAGLLARALPGHRRRVRRRALAMLERWGDVDERAGNDERPPDRGA